jgi:AcrR family transcriptional regulator
VQDESQRPEPLAVANADVGPARAKRLSGAERKRQIIEVTMDVVAQYGVQGTTTSRIAAAAGVSEATLYRHFASRTEMLLAALDLVYERVFRVIRGADQENALDRLRAIGRLHSAIVSSKVDGYVYPLFEFVAAPPEVGLRDALAERERSSISALAAILEDGKSQGAIRPEIDTEQLAWELVGVYWSQDISYLMGLSEYATAERSSNMLERILKSISV